MRPGIFAGQVVLAVFAVLALVALVLPWWRRSRIRRAPTGLKLALSLTATIAIGFLLLNTLRDVEHTTTAGKRMCGGSYLFMLDTRLEITENLYHDCIVYSRVAIALLIALLVAVVALVVLAVVWFFLNREGASSAGAFDSISAWTPLLDC